MSDHYLLITILKEYFCCCFMTHVIYVCVCMCVCVFHLYYNSTEGCPSPHVALSQIFSPTRTQLEIYNFTLVVFLYVLFTLGPSFLFYTLRVFVPCLLHESCQLHTHKSPVLFITPFVTRQSSFPSTTC